MAGVKRYRIPKGNETEHDNHTEFKGPIATYKIGDHWYYRMTDVNNGPVGEEIGPFESETQCYSHATGYMKVTWCWYGDAENEHLYPGLTRGIKHRWNGADDIWVTPDIFNVLVKEAQNHGVCEMVDELNSIKRSPSGLYSLQGFMTNYVSEYGVCVDDETVEDHVVSK